MGQSSATPSMLRTRKSCGVNRGKCAVQRMVLPPTPLNIRGEIAEASSFTG
jgi:hypothetical protein